MRTWARARRARLCGRCGERIAKGAPIFEIYIEAGIFSVKVPKVRCQTCAGIPVPADLAPLVEVSSAITPTVPIPTGPHVLPLDFKSQQFREPGEEG